MQDRLYPSRIGAAGSMNFKAIDGKGVPGFKHFLLNTTDRLHYYIGAIEYKAPSSVGGYPRQYAAVYQSVFRLENGTPTDDLTNFQSTYDAFGDVVQGMAIFDIPDLTTPATFTQGTPGLIISFGNGNPNPAQATYEGVYYRSLSTDTAPWSGGTATEATIGTTYLTCWQMARAGPDLYAVCDAGVAGALGDYRVSKCPAGNNPVLVASWGNGIEVGGPEWNITGIAAIGDSLVVGKPDGLYYYDTQTRRYENVTKHLELVPHPLNFKCLQAVTNGVVGTTHDGGAFFFDGTAVQDISPKKLWPQMSKDIGNYRVTAITDTGDHIILYTELAYQTTQNAGLIINTVTSAGAATAITTNCVDGSMATGGSLNSLAATSHIDIWADIPFEGVVIHITRNSNSTAAAVIGTVSYSSAADTFTADANGFYDGTRLGANGSFSYVAFPQSASAGAVYGKSINFGSLMQKVDFNYSSGTDVSQKYGMRISMSGDALDASVGIDEMEIIPYRAGMPNGGIYSATTNFTNRDWAALIGHAWFLKRQRTTGFIPIDAYAINSGPGVGILAFHNGRLGQASGGQNLGPSLIGWGRYSTWAVSMSPTRDELRSLNTHLADISTTTPGPLMQIAHDWAGRTAEEFDALKTLNWIYLDTWNVQPTDKTEVFAQFDNRDIVSLGVFEGGPRRCPVSQGAFRRLNLWIGFDDAASTDEEAPQFIEPYLIDYDIAGGDIQQDPASKIPILT